MKGHPDERSSRLRALVAEVELTIPDAGADPMRVAWRRLVAALELGPEPEIRACPRCGGLGMLAATRCGHCWSALVPA